ncbi:MAG: FixH family protein [Roseiflexaceae bacterium]|nr:FixH family protein [Roseiflexaceae bacterium]
MRIFFLITTMLLLAACGPTTVTQTNRTERYTVEMLIDGTKVGQRTIGINITDRDGKPVQADVVVVAPVMLEMGMASPEMPATATAPGRYEARGEPFSMLGKWQIDVRITAGGIEDKTTFMVEIT